MTSGLEKGWRHIYSRVLNDVWRASNITLVNNMNYTEPSLNACELFSGRMCVDTNTLHLLNRFRHHAPSAIWSDGRVRQILRENSISELPLLYSECLKFSEAMTSIIYKNVFHLEPKCMCLCQAFHFKVQMKLSKNEEKPVKCLEVMIRMRLWERPLLVWTVDYLKSEARCLPFPTWQRLTHIVSSHFWISKT